jgi:hypothetical protein
MKNNTEQSAEELPTSSTNTDRRAFLRTVALVGATLCFADVKALRAAAVLARAQGKLVFTEGNFNKFIADAFKQSPGVRNQMVAESKANLSAFINKHFTLTPQQNKKLSSLTSADLQAVRGSIDNAVAVNAPMKVTFNAPPTSVPRPKRAPMSKFSGARAAAISAKIHGPKGDVDEVKLKEIGKGPVVYSMALGWKGSVTAKNNGDVSGTVEVSGSC